MTRHATTGLQHRAAHDPRAAALTAFLRVLHHGADSQAALDNALATSSLPPADKGLCTELLYGALRHHMRLRFYLECKLANPTRLPEEMLALLEVAAYELAYARTPDYAVVNWAVNLLRHRFGAGMASVGNAVLRGLRRSMKEEYANAAFYAHALGLSCPEAHTLNILSDVALNSINHASTEPNPLPPEAAVLDTLFAFPALAAVLFALPEDLIRLWLQAYGPLNTFCYARAALHPAPVCVRFNPFFPRRGDISNEMLQRPQSQTVAPAAAILHQTRGARRYAAQGALSMQSAAAYEALWRMNPPCWQPPIWDACAGRGGKTMALMEQGIAISLLTDPSAKRLAGFQKDVERLSLTESLLGFPLPQVEPISAQKWNGNEPFGTVLLDAPCSGLGTLAHRPEIRWRRTSESMTSLISTQRAILDAGARHTKPHGLLVYMTCTINPAENEEQITAFLQRHPGWKEETRWGTPADSMFHEFFWACSIRQEDAPAR